MSLAPQIQTMKLGEVRNVAVSFVGTLDEGEDLAASPTPTLSVHAGLSFANIGVSIAERTINGVATPAGRAVQFNVSASAAGRYRITITATSDATPAQTLKAEIILKVTD